MAEAKAMQDDVTSMIGDVIDTTCGFLVPLANGADPAANFGRGRRDGDASVR
jgi:hypothetical protein